MYGLTLSSGTLFWAISWDCQHSGGIEDMRLGEVPGEKVRGVLIFLCLHKSNEISAQFLRWIRFSRISISF